MDMGTLLIIHDAVNRLSTSKVIEKFRVELSADPPTHLNRTFQIHHLLIASLLETEA